MLEAHAARLAEALRGLLPERPVSGAPRGQLPPPALVVQAMLEPCRGFEPDDLRSLWRTLPSTRTCADLLEVMDRRGGPRALMAEIGVRDARRASVLRLTIEFMIDAQQSHRGPTEAARLRRWAEWTRPGDYFGIGINGLGLREFQRLRALFGANAALPDDHATRLIARLLRRPVSKVQGLYLLERAGDIGNLDVRDADLLLARAASI